MAVEEQPKTNEVSNIDAKAEATAKRIASGRIAHLKSLEIGLTETQIQFLESNLVLAAQLAYFDGIFAGRKDVLEIVNGKLDGTKAA